MASRPGAKPKPKSRLIPKVSGGKGSGSGPPSYEMLESQRKVFEACLTYGVPIDNLLEAFNLDSVATFYRILNRDPLLYKSIEKSRAMANISVAKTLYEKATKDRDTTAIIWWEKTRSKMRDRELTVSEVKDYILNMPMPMREKFFDDLGINSDALKGTGLVIDVNPTGGIPPIKVSFVESPFKHEQPTDAPNILVGSNDGHK